MPLVELDSPEEASIAAIKSPKSAALPADKKVIYCITFIGPLPPPRTPLVLLETPARPVIEEAKSPKSVALPVVAKLNISILALPPPAKIPKAGGVGHPLTF